MSSEISIEVIKKTQETLGQFVKKPPLTEKLLKKPPFRYLHDIIMAVNKNTNFFEGLFTEEELVSEKVKDRDKKILFLQKAIKVINFVFNINLSVRPSKIISGQEPEKTNEFLQKIGEALQKKLNSAEAIAIITKDDKKESAVEEKKQKKKLNKNDDANNTKKEIKIKNQEPVKKDNKNLMNAKKSKTDSGRTKTKNTIVSQSSVEIQPKSNIDDKILMEPLLDNAESIDDNIDDKKNEKIMKDEYESLTSLNSEITNVLQNIPEDEQLDSKPPLLEKKLLNGRETPVINKIDSKDSDEKININIEKTERENNINNEPNFTEKEQSSHVKSGSKKNKTLESVESKSTVDNKIENNLQSKLLENPINNNESKTSMPLNEKINIKSLRPPSVRPSSSRPGAPRFKDTNLEIVTIDTNNKGKVNIIVEDYDKKIEDDDSGVTVESSITEDSLSNNMSLISSTKNQSDHGHLVQQILETQKELSGQTQKIEIEWEWGTKKERETAFREVESLKDGLQLLSRAANPLCKLIEYIQEDVEIMKQELFEWREIRKSSAEIFASQNSNVDKVIKPLETKLKQLDENIMEQIDLINTVKSSIIRNSKKIKDIISNN